MGWQQLHFFPISLQHHFSFLLVDLWNCWQHSCLLLLDFQLTRMRYQEVFSLLLVEYSAALYAFCTISNHLLLECPLMMIKQMEGEIRPNDVKDILLNTVI